MISDPDMPAAIRQLPRDAGGAPRLWLGDRRRALAGRRCWFCGQRLNGGVGAFLISVPSALARTGYIPPLHPACATWGAQIENARMADAAVLGPEVVKTVIVFETTSWRPITGPRGVGALVLGEPVQVSWFYAGAPMRRDAAQAIVERVAAELCGFMAAKGEDPEPLIERLLRWLPTTTDASRATDRATDGGVVVLH